MRNLNLYKFIARCLMLDHYPGNREEIVGLIENEEINWRKFTWTCSSNLVLQTVYVRFRDHDLLELIPVDLASHLKEIYHLNLERNNSILTQIKELTKVLNGISVRPVFMKGAGNLLDGLYTDPGERIMADIDLLIPESGFLPAANALLEKGYYTRETIYELPEHLMHYPALFSDRYPADVEVHRMPVLKRWSGRFRTEDVLEKKVAAIDPEGCDLLSAKDRVIQNFIHSQLSNENAIKGVVWLRDLYDIFLLSYRVDLAKLLEEMPYKKKALNYFQLASVFFKLQGESLPGKTIRSGIYLEHCRLNLSSSTYNRIFRFLYGFTDLFLIRYPSGILNFLFSKKNRKTIARKISSKEWYKRHFRSFSSRFH